MIANVSAHRRAHAFARALEQKLPGDEAAGDGSARWSDADVPPEAAPLLAVTERLGGLPRPELDLEVKTVQRAQLVAAMEAQVAEGEARSPSKVAGLPSQRGARAGHREARRLGRLRPRSRLSKSLAAGGLTVGVAAGAFSGVAAASSDALPGDTLYGLKRGMEDFRLTLSGDDSDRGRLYLDQASTRMLEARRLMERGRSGHLDHESIGEIRKALSGVTHDASEGHRLLHAAYKKDGDLGPIQALSSFTRAHRRSWDQLRHNLPVQLTDVSRDVSSVFAAIDHEVTPLQPLLPHSPRAGRARQGAPSHPTASGSAGHHSAPSGGSSHSSGHRTHSARPSAKTSQGEGLLGGSTGGLLPPPSSNDSPASADGRSGKSGQSAAPDITLPPLLPGLLPGLGISAEDDK